MKIILYVRKPKLQKPDDLYEGMPVYQCWPRSVNMDNSNAESWANGRTWQTHYECVKLEVENKFDIILAGGVSFRGQSAKVPIGLIWNGELQAYLSFDFRVDYLMAALDVCDVRQRVIDRKMSFIYKGSNYYPVPYGSEEYLVYEKAQDAKAKGIRPKYTKSYSVGDVILSQGEHLIYLGELTEVEAAHVYDQSKYTMFGRKIGTSTRPLLRQIALSKTHGYYHESGYISFYDNKKSTVSVSKPNPQQEKKYKQLQLDVIFDDRSATITSDVCYKRGSCVATYVSLKDNVVVRAPNYIIRPNYPVSNRNTRIGEPLDVVCDDRRYIRGLYNTIVLENGVLTFTGNMSKPLVIDTRNA